MLDMLRKLLHQEGVASKLCSMGMISALEVLQDTGSPQVQRSADRTLTALIQGSLTLPNQPVNPIESSQHVLRSRCQSNSPVLLDPLHKQRLSHKLSTSDRRTKHGRISHSRDSQEHVLHTFGSQQGMSWMQQLQFVSSRLHHDFCHFMFLAGISLCCCCLSLLIVQKYLLLVMSSALYPKQQVAKLQQAMKQQLVYHVEHNGDGRHRQQQLSHQSLKSILGHCKQSL